MPIKETKTPDPGEKQAQSINVKKVAPLIALLAFLAIAGAGGSYYYYSQLSELRVNPQKAAAEETKAMVERVSKLIVLPTDEQPTIATVADPERLKDQPFFAKSQRGDKVLIYTNARKAILYDPNRNKIIEVAPLNIGQAAGATTQGTGTAE